MSGRQAEAASVPAPSLGELIQAREHFTNMRHSDPPPDGWWNRDIILRVHHVDRLIDQALGYAETDQ